jgi:hypothetical protein
VKTLCADGSVPFRHARVGHRQASNKKPLRSQDLRGFFLLRYPSGNARVGPRSARDNETDTLPSGPVKFAGLNSQQRESGPREIRIRE